MAEVDQLCIHRDPSVLQLSGASRATASIPFQVYHMPDGHFEVYDTWIKRVLPENPVEAIYGLYDMVRHCMHDIMHHLCTYLSSEHLFWYAKVLSRS